jgi:IS5 family transposase
LLKHCEHLPSYKQFCLRVNRLAPFFAAFCNAELKAKQKTSKTHLTDSAPVVVAKGSRSSRAKTAGKLCDKGYCASKKMWYYGVKIHILAEEREHTLPIPRRFLITKASEHDLNAGKIMLENAEDIEVFADKAYIDDDWGYELQLRYVELITPFKERSKNQIPLDDGERAWNAMITSRRQQIETLVSQISEIACLQDAHFARSENGLLAFIWARLAVLAFAYW